MEVACLFDRPILVLPAWCPSIDRSKRAFLYPHLERGGRGLQREAPLKAGEGAFFDKAVRCIEALGPGIGVEDLEGEGGASTRLEVGGCRLDEGVGVPLAPVGGDDGGPPVVGRRSPSPDKEEAHQRALIEKPH